MQSNDVLWWAAAVCVVGVWRSERDGVIEERAGGGAEAQHRGPEEPCMVPRTAEPRGAQ